MSLVPGRRWAVLAFVCLITIGWAEQSAGQTLTLKWDPSPDPRVAGYIVYAGTQSGKYTSSFNVGTETSFTYRVLPEQQYFFAVASYAPGLTVGPVSAEVAGAAHAVTLLSDPGNQVTALGSPTELQLLGMDSFEGTLTFSAAGLPPGIDIDNSTGRVSGTPTTAGNYVVTVSASDGLSLATQTFTWTISAPDSTPPVVTVTMPGPSNGRMVLAHAISVGGVAADDTGIVAVTWANSRGDSGTATGTDVWLAGVVLHGGRNDITITASDPAGNQGTATFSIYRQP